MTHADGIQHYEETLAERLKNLRIPPYAGDRPLVMCRCGRWQKRGSMKNCRGSLRKPAHFVENGWAEKAGPCPKCGHPACQGCEILVNPHIPEGHARGAYVTRNGEQDA